MTNLNSIQLELTTRCTLKCPACSRTSFAEILNRPMPNRDMDPDMLWDFLNCESGRKIEHLYLCGDHGDSIYYPKLLYFLEKFRNDRYFTIVTNGSYQNQKFWNEVCARMDSRDKIFFSIDGLGESNSNYRVNADWESILTGLETVSKTDIELVWETNIFSFNYDKLDEMKRFAESYGAKFIAKKTGRHGKTELAPPIQFINSDEIYRPEYSDPHKITIVEPNCVHRYQNIISASNYFLPCGFISGPMALYKSKIWKERDKWYMKGQTLDDVIQNALNPWIQNIKDNPQSCEVICKMKCKKDQPRREVISV